MRAKGRTELAMDKDDALNRIRLILEDQATFLMTCLRNNEVV